MKADDMNTRKVRDNSGIRFPPPLIYVSLLILGFVIQFFWPVQLVAPSRVDMIRIAGAIAVVCGFLLMATAIGVFKSVGTSLIPMKPSTALAFTGPYRFTRNPMYLGMLLVSGGIALVSNALWPLLTLPIMVIVVNRTVIRREERYLASKFGEPYTTYTSRVRRWI
jgi:protein-S-isoprenylcysteine O-methyltransferase Ste14